MLVLVLDVFNYSFFFVFEKNCSKSWGLSLFGGFGCSCGLLVVLLLLVFNKFFPGV